MKNTKYKIYLDADGVLCNFEKKVEEITGKRITEIPKNLVWQKISWYNNNVEPFFESLEKMDGADKLFNFCNDNFENVSILTATGNTPKNAAAQKRNWFQKNYGNVNVITVNKSGDKAQYANDSAILVDDRTKSIDPWVAAGGIGILHFSVENTIRHLQSLLTENS